MNAASRFRVSLVRRRAQMLCIMYESAGYVTDAAALALAATIRPRVILMDLAMVELDGFETTRRLRENAGTKACIIVAVTARAFAADRNEAIRAGCDGFISKPLDLATLADYVDRILRQGRSACDVAVTR